MKTWLSCSEIFLRKKINGYIDPRWLKQFVLKKVSPIMDQKPGGESVTEEVRRIQNNLADLGWIEPKRHLISEPVDETLLKQAEIWIRSLENGRVINRGKISRNAAAYLDLLCGVNEDPPVEVSAAMESLLKFVENKRRKFMKAFSDRTTAEIRIQEGLWISILFSRYACQRRDARFLNAALKINDWFFSRLRSKSGGKSPTLFLLALTEQKKCAMELLN